MKKHAPLPLLIAAALLPGCYNESHLDGDAENEGGDARLETIDAVHDPVPEEIIAEAAREPDAFEVMETIDVAETTDAGDGVEGQCCEPPMVLDPVKGICIDPTGYGAGCYETPDTCAFGQLCVPEFGIALLGYFCEVTCGPDDNFLCPEGYVCYPPQCCDIPGQGCVIDTCAPPLAMHPGMDTCVTFEGVGVDCASALTCGAGQTCLSWYGIDGIERHTCEVECAGSPRLCPNGTMCVDWDDGPSNICEPAGGQRGCDDPQARVCGRPEKFNDEDIWAVDRTTVCPRCYGVKFCVLPDGVSQVQYLSDNIRCGGQGMCGSDQTECIFGFRSGADDCHGMMPSDFFWTAVCAAANLEAVRSVTCYYLE